MSMALDGAVAQLGERFNGIEEVRGSNPLSSTSIFLNGWTVSSVGRAADS